MVSIARSGCRPTPTTQAASAADRHGHRPLHTLCNNPAVNEISLAGILELDGGTPCWGSTPALARTCSFAALSSPRAHHSPTFEPHTEKARQRRGTPKVSFRSTCSAETRR